MDLIVDELEEVGVVVDVGEFAALAVAAIFVVEEGLRVLWGSTRNAKRAKICGPERWKIVQMRVRSIVSARRNDALGKISGSSSLLVVVKRC